MDGDLRKRFGELVGALRRRRDLSQQALAEKAGLRLHMVQRVERGLTGARFPTIEKLAEALDVDPAELFSPDLPKGLLQQRELTAITTRLARLSDTDLIWLRGVIDAALASRPKGKSAGERD